MGCGSSKDKANQQTTGPRRRLSVGHVEGGGEAATGTEAEEDRGIITELDAQSVLDMIGEGNGGRKMSIGSETDQSKTSFSNKATKKDGDADADNTAGLGYTCRKGLKPEAPNQDSWIVLKMEEQSIYGVFDGHGQKGHDVSEFVKNNLPKLIIRDKRFKTDATNDDLKEMLIEAFKRMQSLVVTADRMKKLSAQMSGTTATVCVHNTLNKKITLAHAADSTAVLAEDKSGSIKGLQLTRDHKPNLKDERARIEKAGGRVVFDGYANHRVYAKNARYPGLNMSRCIGDILGHQDCGITAEPEVSTLDLTDKHKFLLLCSDGVWEFVSPDESVNIINQFDSSKAMPAAEKLAKESWDRWIKEEGGAVVDDITVVLLYLNSGGGAS